jgi:hypothetical protein
LEAKIQGLTPTLSNREIRAAPASEKDALASRWREVYTSSLGVSEKDIPRPAGGEIQESFCPPVSFENLTD